MSGVILPRDVPLWRAACPYLDVRSNDEHTLFSYRLGRGLLRFHPEAREEIVLPAIVLHDVGWKMFPEEKLAQAVGPNAKYPELQRAHEIEGARIARDLLERLAIPGVPIEPVLAIIDGHDTRKEAISIEDALMKDADKLWRFTPHGIATISSWFAIEDVETVAMLESYVVPSLLTPAGRMMAEALLATGETSAWMTKSPAEERIRPR